MLRVKSRDFGEVTVREEEVFDFSQPPFGFEHCTRFALIRKPEIGDQLVWLQALEDPSVCFILFDPSGFAEGYDPQPGQDSIEALGPGQLLCWVIGVVPEDFSKATVNLKSPIIINPATGRGAQIILEQDYPVRYYIMQEAN